MKKMLLTLALLGLNALATVPSNDIRLELSKHRLFGWQKQQLQLSVKLDSKGLVFAKQEDGTEVFVAYLDEDERAEVESLIAEASLSRYVFGPTPLCEAIPTRSVVYTADNGKLPLFSDTSPCGGSARRQGDAADTLIELLDKFVKHVPETNILIAELNG